MDLLSWLPWVFSGGTLLWIALAIFAPTILQIITPVLKAVLEALIEYLKVLYKGIRFAFKNFETLVLIGTLCAVSYFYGFKDSHAVKASSFLSKGYNSKAIKKSTVKSKFKEEEYFIKIPGMVD